MATAPATSTSGSGTSHAVVIGASMAGLLAARALAGHVDRVTLVDRDRLPDGSEHRKGVPQGRQPHLLLARCLAVLDGMFPGFSQELEAAGAVPVGLPRDVALLTKAGWMDRDAEGWTSLSASRPLIEAITRRRLLDLPGITLLQRCEVTALETSGDGRAVRGVTVRREEGDTVVLDADLVVDAAGRGSRAVRWLTDLGYPTPERTEIDSGMVYASRLYRIPAGSSPDWKAVMLMARPPDNPRTGVIFPLEGGRWILGLMGAAGQQPPTDEDGFVRFMRRLPHPLIAEAVASAEPVSDIRAHRGTVNRKWHVERLPRWPERFVVLGDAVCAFNPVYGQGITTAALGAETLDECLRGQRRRRPDGDLDGLAGRFQRVLARRNADPWMLSTGEDLRYPTTTGSTANRLMRAQHRYVDRVELAATQDAAVTEVYTRVLGMLERPTALFRPRIAAAALRARRTAEETPERRPGIPAPRDAGVQPQRTPA